MQKLYVLLLCCAIAISSFSQQIDLAAFNKERVSYTKKSMLILGGWSAANIITSAFATNTKNDEMHYFHQMNVQWNSVNLVIAALGYWSANREKNNNSTFARVLKRQNGVEKTYLINLGLDVAYIAGGLYLTERGKRNKNPAQFKGYGNAIMFQSGFLLLYDAVNYFIHNKHGKKLDKVLDKMQINGGPGAVSLTYRL